MDVCVHTQTYIRIHRPTHRHRVTTKKWFQWKRIMKHHLHLKTLRWMKAITQTCAAHHQKHDPQITKQVCKSVSKNASIEHHTTSSLGGFKKRNHPEIWGRWTHFWRSIFFSNGLKPPTRTSTCAVAPVQGAASSQQQLFLAWMQSMGRRQVRSRVFWGGQKRRLNRVIQHERKYVHVTYVFHEHCFLISICTCWIL